MRSFTPVVSAALSLVVACAARQLPPAGTASISKADAERLALAQVSNGTVREGELETEHGVLVWSFDIATSGTQNITEVQVDAISGRIVSIATETPSHERVEKQQEHDAK